GRDGPRPDLASMFYHALLQCHICYQMYSAHSRKPKILDCLHRVCAHCLTKMNTGYISCPFCRNVTPVSGCNVANLPEDTNIMSRLVSMDRSWSSDHIEDVILSPKSLAEKGCATREGSTCLVITIMEVRQDVLQQSTSPNGNDSPDTVSTSTESQPGIQSCNGVPRVLVWLLGFLHFGSLPLGIYLLVIQRVTLGIVCVSLVPSSLTVCLVYWICQCLCQDSRF
uniref:E3 ubiquitin-protein ligase RNF182 n=1 Tax=Denticeps clupeoides TaxID=299321 RepID=A0AAY4D393_9TELE